MTDRNLDEELKRLENMPCAEVFDNLMFDMRSATATIVSTTSMLQQFSDGTYDVNIEELGKIIEHQQSALDKMMFIHQLYLAYRDKRWQDNSSQEVD